MTDDLRTTAWLLLAATCLITVAIAFCWYKAGVQVDVYQRQNVSMSQWEVFIGTEPVERYMQEREQAK